MVKLPYKLPKPTVLPGDNDRSPVVEITSVYEHEARTPHCWYWCYAAGKYDPHSGEELKFRVVKDTKKVTVYQLGHESGGYFIYCADCVEPWLRELGIIW